MSYPTELIPTANGVMSYIYPAPEALGEDPSPEEVAAHGARTAAKAQYDEAMLKASPVDKIVGAFDALKGVASDLDADGLRVLASCAEQIVLNGFHGKGAEALPVRDAARAALDAEA